MKFAASRRSGAGSTARTVGLAAIACLGILLSGCGLGPGEETGTAGLMVTRDYGREVMVDETGLPVNESSTAMRLLDEKAELETAYGGEYVQAVDGYAGDSKGGRSFDWFFSVNGIVAERGSAQFPLTEGETVWWDYRDWTDAMEVGAVVGAYPAPLATGYDDRDWGVEIECLDDQVACGMVEKQLEGDGVSLRDTGQNMRVVVGTWSTLEGTDEGAKIARGPDASGVFAGFDGDGSGPASLVGLDVRGDEASRFGPEAGLVAAMRHGDGPPVWLLTGGAPEGVRMAAAALNPEDLKLRYAAVVSDREVSSLPLP